jgi:xanthine dehydrogenase accessory factor
MRAWLPPLAEILERGDAAILVHVAELKGSGPREAGAQMLVTETGIAGTIGGGELEHSAMLKARELLQSGSGALVRLALGPELNQCCGGSVTLAFEPFAPADLAWVRKLIRTAEEPMLIVRTLRLGETGQMRRDWKIGDGDGPDFSALFSLSPLAGERGSASAIEIRERMNAPAQALWLFGAGHVGRALAQALLPLGFDMTWVDGRAGQLPEPPLRGVKQLALAMPELAVDEAPPGAIFLVMTHSHPLDEAICEAVLRRQDFSYLGLIGSATKRARFVKRLRQAGIPGASLDRLICPIGLTGIKSKEPAAIAASVAADLLLRRERGFAVLAATVRHGG